MASHRGSRLDWAKLTEYLMGADGDLLLTFGDLERICGGSLPASKEYPAFWSNSSGYARHWVQAGYKVSRARCLPGQLRFLRTGAPATPSRPSPMRPTAPAWAPQPSRGAAADVVLVGCVKTKRSTASEARDLYMSPLFQRRRAYAEQAGVPWFILSAEYGLIAPTEFLSPYDTYLPDLAPAYRRVWGEWCATRLNHLVGSLAGMTVEIHAGESYVSAVAPPLIAKGAHLRAPLEGMRQGEQLAWYDTEPSEGRITIRGEDDDPAQEPHHSTSTSPQAVSDALLEFRRIQLDDAKAEPLGGRGEAGHLLATDPFAFLVAVIFDEGIVAERAWEAPP